ncbi:MAG: ABC transporter ATP-binding protein [Myxococcota bacterium]
MSTIALQVRGLTRHFGSRTAVRSLDLSVHEGDVYGFLGPNGAGKTTALRCILGLIRADSGTVEIFGETGRSARRFVGAMVETPAFHEWASGRDNLAYSAAYAGLSSKAAGIEIERVLERVGLTERARDPAGRYSLGMRQRLAIARALLGRPRLLLLDEPTNGLDPAGMREVRDLVRSLALHDKITVFLSSHLLAEVQAICNRVGILDDGSLRAEGEVNELLRSDGSPVLVVEVGAPKASLESAVAGWPEVEVEGPGMHGRVRLRLKGLDAATLNRRLLEAGVAVDALVPERRNLEDVFLEVTSGAPR